MILYNKTIMVDGKLGDVDVLELSTEKFGLFAHETEKIDTLSFYPNYEEPSTFQTPHLLITFRDMKSIDRVLEALMYLKENAKLP